jgi:hypothetical protein
VLVVCVKNFVTPMMFSDDDRPRRHAQARTLSPPTRRRARQCLTGALAVATRARRQAVASWVVRPRQPSVPARAQTSSGHSAGRAPPGTDAAWPLADHRRGLGAGADQPWPQRGQGASRYRCGLAIGRPPTRLGSGATGPRARTPTTQRRRASVPRPWLRSLARALDGGPARTASANAPARSA